MLSYLDLFRFFGTPPCPTCGHVPPVSDLYDRRDGDCPHCGWPRGWYSISGQRIPASRDAELVDYFLDLAALRVQNAA